MANMTIPTSRDIYLELNGRKLAVVQGYNARACLLYTSPSPRDA